MNDTLPHKTASKGSFAPDIRAILIIAGLILLQVIPFANLAAMNDAFILGWAAVLIVLGMFKGPEKHPGSP